MDEKLLWALRQKGVIEILIYIYKNKTAKYSDLKNLIKKESTLIRAINILVEQNLVNRNVLNEKYRPTKYELTEKGTRVAHHLFEIFST